VSAAEGDMEARPWQESEATDPLSSWGLMASKALLAHDFRPIDGSSHDRLSVEATSRADSGMVSDFSRWQDEPADA